MTEIDVSELRKKIGPQKTKLGESEFQLAVAKANELFPDASSLQLVKTVSDFIDEHRDKFSLGSRYMSEEAWQKVYDQAEASARAELLSHSSEQKEVDRLLTAAETSKKLADQADARLRSSITEFFGLPDQAGKLAELFARIQYERDTLNRPQLENAYKELYRSAVLRPKLNHADGADLIQMLITADLRLAVLKIIEAETTVKFDALEARNKELAKKLGRPAHKIDR